MSRIEARIKIYSFSSSSWISTFQFLRKKKKDTFFIVLSCAVRRQRRHVLITGKISREERKRALQRVWRGTFTVERPALRSFCYRGWRVSGQPVFGTLIELIAGICTVTVKQYDWHLRIKSFANRNLCNNSNTLAYRFAVVFKREGIQSFCCGLARIDSNSPSLSIQGVSRRVLQAEIKLHK